MSVQNFNPEKDNPLNIVVVSESVIPDGPPYISVKMTEEGVIVDFIQNGEVTRTWARTYTELWEESETL